MAGAGSAPETHVGRSWTLVYAEAVACHGPPSTDHLSTGAAGWASDGWSRDGRTNASKCMTPSLASPRPSSASCIDACAPAPSRYMIGPVIVLRSGLPIDGQPAADGGPDPLGVGGPGLGATGPPARAMTN